MNCKNCNTELNSKYCPNCGQPSELKKINGHYIIHEIEHVLHFERGILYTIKKLLTNPGQSIRSYLTENRSKLVKPIIFIIVTSLIYTLLIHFFHVDDGYVKYREATKQTTTSLIVKWVQDHYGYANIIWAYSLLFFKNNFLENMTIIFTKY